MFNLDKEQQQKLSDWQAEQDTLLESTYAGAIGGRFTYSFTPTSLDTIVKVTDGLTNNTIDLTDYDSW
jgi:hypothetical protein